ncbi:MAG TPA: hypothetical protein VMA97_13825 [Streptosporangiaceae bacterium]|jgi:hypothetical protein|nr:hypothetical protein [Streptosporangiaceae bacterium]
MSMTVLDPDPEDLAAPAGLADRSDLAGGAEVLLRLAGGRLSP